MSKYDATTVYLLVLRYPDNRIIYYSDLFRTESKAKRIAEECKSDDDEIISYEIIKLNYWG